MGDRRLVISDYIPEWPDDFRRVARSLRRVVGDEAVRIDHIGSTAVPGLTAKALIDVQITVRSLVDSERWDDELLPGLLRRHEITADHVPPGGSSLPQEWAKCYWSDRGGVHLHVRQEGRLNQRYALLFRDYLRADAAAAGAYGRLKRALADAAPDDLDAYYAVKDPACDLIIAAAEQRTPAGRRRHPMRSRLCGTPPARSTVVPVSDDLERSWRVGNCPRG